MLPANEPDSSPGAPGQPGFNCGVMSGSPALGPLPGVLPVSYFSPVRFMLSIHGKLPYICPPIVNQNFY
jgi:hypothetical protein